MTVSNDAAHPTPAAAATAAAAALDRPVDDVRPFEEGMNAVYRVVTDGHDAVLKVGTAQRGPRLRSGPLLAERLAAETTVPVPAVLATVPAVESPIDRAYYLMEHVPGREVTDALALSPSAHRRLVREAAAHLAAVHALPFDGAFGRLVARDGALSVGHRFDTWRAAFRTEVDYCLDGLDRRFADLAPAVRDAADPLPATDRAVDRAILYRDYHPKNLVLGPDDAEPLVRAVLDFNFRPVGDAPLDVAVAETHLVDVPLGGTERGAELRRALRDAYVEARGGTHAAHFGPRYPAYRLVAWLDVCRHYDYFGRFVREPTPDDAVDRLRSTVRTLVAEA